MYEEDHSWSFAAGIFVGALVGAALASLFTPRSGPQNREMVRERGLVLKDRVTDATSTATNRVGDATTSVTGRVGNVTSTVTERVSGAASTVAERASTVAATVADRAGDAITTVQETASTAATRVVEAASTATEKVTDVASTAATRASEVAATATEKARDLAGRGADTAGTTGGEISDSVGQGTGQAMDAPGYTGATERIVVTETVILNPDHVTDADAAATSAATLYDADTDMLITDTSEVSELNAAGRALESDEQFDASVTRDEPRARTYTSLTDSGTEGGGEVPGTGSGTQA